MTTKQEIPQGIIKMGMICITILAGTAIMMGYDKWLLTIVLTILAAAIGVIIPQPKIKTD